MDSTDKKSVILLEDRKTAEMSKELAVAGIRRGSTRYAGQVLPVLLMASMLTDGYAASLDMPRIPNEHKEKEVKHCLNCGKPTDGRPCCSGLCVKELKAKQRNK